MQPKFSAYLDIVRFLAALAVFLGHAAGAYWTQGFLWQLGPYGDTCVVIFFVLSGFVIAFVADRKEGNWWTYGANRIARLWSVVIPALALTFVIDAIGVRMAPALYIGQPWFNGDHLGLRYLASFFLVHETWHLDYAPGINQPFWSLGYEAFYYLMFGLLAFYKGRARTFVLLAALAVGGPLMAALFPIWMSGVFAYRMSRTRTLPLPAALLMFVAGGLVLVLSPVLRPAVSVTWMGQEIAGRYLEAVAFVMHLLAAHRLLNQDAPLPPRLALAIKRVASTTFVLYLFHRPLIQLFSFIGPADAGSWGRRALVIGGSLAVVALATPLCERLQRTLRALWLRWLTPASQPAPARAVSEALVPEPGLYKLDR
jgi:peptidoglycan/LPS O-acetylase OafA/YrhL